MRWLGIVGSISLAIVTSACSKKAGPAADGQATKGKAGATTAPTALYDLKKLEADLRATSRERRTMAIKQVVLLDEEGEDVLPTLLDALRDPACDALGTSSADRATSAREAAVQGLLTVPEGRGKKALVESGLKSLEAGLRDTKATVREHTANAIGMVGPDAKSIADAVAKLCVDRDREVRAAAYRALEKIKSFDQLPVLKLLTHPDLAIATEAAGALSWMKPSGAPAVNALVDGIKRPTREKDSPTDVQYIRTRSAEAITATGKDAAVAVTALVDLIEKTSDEDVERLIRAKNQKTPQLPGAVTALRKIGAPALAGLRPLLKHERSGVRYQAAAAIGGMGKSAAEALPDIQTALENERGLPTGQMYVFEELAAAAISLGAEAGTIATAAIQLLDSDDDGVRARGCQIIGRIGRKAATAVPKLTELLNDKNTKVQLAAIEALGMVGPAAKDAAVELGKKVEGDDPLLARPAALTLQKLGPLAAPAIPSLARALSTNDTSVGIEAVAAIAAIGSEAVGAVEAIVKLLDDKNSRPEEQKNGLAAIAAIGAPAKAAAPAATRFLNDRDPTLRVAAIEAMARIAGPEAATVTAIAEKLSDGNASVQIATVKALGTIGAPAKSAADKLKPLVTRQGSIRIWAAATLSVIGVDSDANAKIVIDAIKDNSGKTALNRYVAVEALGILGAKGRTASSDLIAVMKEKPTGVVPKGDQATIRELAARSAGKLGLTDSDTVRALADLLRDPAPNTRRAAAQVLGQIGDKALTAVPKLREIVSDPVAGEAAAQAIEKIETGKTE